MSIWCLRVTKGGFEMLHFESAFRNSKTPYGHIILDVPLHIGALLRRRSTRKESRKRTVYGTITCRFECENGIIEDPRPPRNQDGNRIPAVLYHQVGSRQDAVRRNPMGNAYRLDRQRQGFGDF